MKRKSTLNNIRCFSQRLIKLLAVMILLPLIFGFTNNTKEEKSLIKANQLPPTVSIGSNTPVCSGETLFLTESGAGGVTWQWSGPNGFSSYTQNPNIPNITVAAAGNYFVTVTDVAGETTTSSAAVAIVQAPTAIVGSNPAVANGENINLTESGADATGWNWTGPNTFTSSVQNPVISNATSLNEGVYYLTITDATACPTRDSACVTLIRDFCPGDICDLDAPAGYTNYQWYVNGVAIVGATSASHQVTVLTSTVDTLTFTAIDPSTNCPVNSFCPRVIRSTTCEIGDFVWEDSNQDGIQDVGEPGIENVIITLYNAAGEIVAIDTTDASGQYLFNQVNITAYSGQADTTLLFGSDYYLVAGIGQMVDGELIVNSLAYPGPTLPNVGSGASPDLNDSDAAIGNAGGGDPAFTDGFSFIMMTTTSNYVENGSDFGWNSILPCPVFTTVTADVDICTGFTVPELAVSSTVPLPDSIAFVYFTTPQTDSSIIYSAGIGIDTIAASATNDTTRIFNIPFPANTGTTTQTYYVYTIQLPPRKNVDCRDYDEILVNVHPTPTFGPVPTDPTCYTYSDGSIAINPDTPYSPYNWTWSDGTATGSGTGTTISALAEGNYNITVTDGNGCVATNTTALDDPPPVLVSGVGVAPTTNGGADGSITLTITNGTPPITWVWDDGTTTGSGSGTTISSLPAGTYTITVTDATAPAGCQGTTIVVVPEADCVPIKRMIILHR